MDGMNSPRRGRYPLVYGFLAAAMFGLTACATSPAAPSEGDSPSGVKTIKVQGQLTSGGVECPAMKADNGTIYTLLGDLKGFKAGDRVVVEATPVEVSFCMQGTTIRVVQISRPQD